MSCVKLLPLCSNPVIVNRTGLTGPYGYLNALGIGIWFANGGTFTDPKSERAQDTSRTYIGTAKPDTFTKGFVTPQYAACPVA